MPSIDHLCTVPTFLTGMVVSVRTAREGEAFIVVDDSGVDIGNRRRWIAYSADIQNPDDKIRIGSKVTFLPGSARKGKAMGRAYDVRLQDGQ